MLVYVLGLVRFDIVFGWLCDGYNMVNYVSLVSKLRWICFDFVFCRVCDGYDDRLNYVSLDSLGIMLS